MHLKAQSSQIQGESDKKEMSKMMKGLRKIIAKSVSGNGQRVIEGKEHMSFKRYQQTCKHLRKDGSPDSVITLSLITMQWNLISRSEATENIFFKQIK